MRMAFGDSSASDTSSECDSPVYGHQEAASGHLLIHSEVPGLYQAPPPPPPSLDFPGTCNFAVREACDGIRGETFRLILGDEAGQFA